MHIRRFVLVVMGLGLLAGCASAAPSDRAEPEVVGSDSAALTGNGVAQLVSQLESGVAAMAVVVGETGSFQPKSHGIPHRMAAIDARVSAIQSDVAALASVSFSGSATLAQLQSSSFALDKLIDLVNQVSNDAKTKLTSIGATNEAVSIGDMFSMQMLMNHLSQMGEMSAAVVTALNQAIIDMARGTKGA
jgi:hypothetical protein